MKILSRTEKSRVFKQKAIIVSIVGSVLFINAVFCSAWYPSWLELAGASLDWNYQGSPNNVQDRLENAIEGNTIIKDCELSSIHQEFQKIPGGEAIFQQRMRSLVSLSELSEAQLGPDNVFYYAPGLRGMLSKGLLNQNILVDLI